MIPRYAAFTVLVASFISGCVDTSGVAESHPVKLTSAQISMIEETVTHDFFDPSSAQFRNLHAADVVTTEGKSVRRVCGEVNGKNQLGGYVGFEMFGGVMEDGKFVRRDFFMPCEPN